MINKIDLTKGKVSSVLLKLAIPIMGSSLLQFTYNLVDMIWIGGMGSDAVASIGSSSFFLGLGYSINSLVVIGTGIKVAHSIGKKDYEEVQKYINSGILLNTIIGIIYGLILILFGRNFIGFLNLNNRNVESGAYLYILVSVPMLFFAFFNLLYTRIFNSYGNNKMALKLNAIGIVVNIVLDPIFIYGFKLGILGASFASLVANMTIFIIFLVKARGILKYDKTYKVDYVKIKEIINLGFPMAFQRILFTIVNIILAKIIAIFGSDAIAAQKIGLQIESISFMVIGGLNGAISSFTGQNFGAKKFDRIIEGYRTALKIGLVYSIITAILFIFIPEILVIPFIREKETMNLAIGYLKILAFSQIFSTIEIVSNGLFTGIGKPKIPAGISIIFTISRIPMALLFIKFIGLNGIWISITLSSILKGICAYIIYRFTVWREYVNVRIS